MNFLPLDKMWERVEIAREDNDLSFFMSLMYLGEMLTKCVVAGMTAAIIDDKQRNRYQIMHRLVRADGLGQWVEILNEIVTGPALQFMMNTSGDCRDDLTKRVGDDSWQYQAVFLLHRSMRLYGLPVEDLPIKVDCRRFFSLFSTFRNKTRGHGVPQTAKCSLSCADLEKSLRIICENLSLFKRSWAYLHRNYSGKYRVTKFTENIEPFSQYKSATNLTNYPDGIYIYYDRPAWVEMIVSDPDVIDFFFPNGQFTDKKFELLSYVTEGKKDGDSTLYLLPAAPLPESETQGMGILETQGKSFGNLPRGQQNYVSRPILEEQLSSVLKDDHHPIVTLVGRGGIGKTWLALQVLHRLTELEHFAAIIWFSARDIDLLPQGPKRVKPQILDENDIADELVRLLAPPQPKGFKSRNFLSENLTKCQLGPILFVFDNFETVNNPVELYTWIDTYLRLPNKVLITTRLRDFKADYFVEVPGMNEEEAESLINATAINLNISGLLTQKYKEDIYQESEGHPYVIKIMLGEVAKANRLVAIERIVADSEALLKALFERTFTGLSPAAKRVFLTLCNWHSMVPQLAIEAVLLRPSNEKIDVLNAIDELVRSSFIEKSKSEKDQEVFLSVPLAATLFGKKKLVVSPLKSAIEADTQLLRAFGSAQASDLNSGILPRIKRLFTYIAEKVSKNKDELSSYISMLEFIGRKYPPVWLMLASLYEESDIDDKLEKAKESVRSYIETSGTIENQEEGWRKLANYCIRTQDWLGEIHAWVEIAQLPGASFQDISTAANRFNALFSKQPLMVDTDEKQIIVNKLLEIMEKRSEEGDATDYSRLAWLAMNVHDELKAKKYTEKGMGLDPYNPHIQSLASKLNIYWG